MNTLKNASFLCAVVLCFSSVSQAAQIECAGRDGTGRNVLIQMVNIAKDVDGYGVGRLQAVTIDGLGLISSDAYAVGRRGKVEDPAYGLNRDLYIEGGEAFLNLKKVASQKYTGEFCGPQKNSNVGGVRLTDNDCIAVTCESRGLSTLRSL
ncbi:hypothetical protein AZI87_12080 [Bdellovibrio bacteriovorus]|uniref:Uncharacterized protein n=1 Tax=Bdellovibrio bacteriovorus TaxID=959 RepID=A0A162G8L6_BDEBC|nr:hypothetical protein [Bdellovibrio bacteriovorus]KYG65287.1 hypothetical protein AZI87_12080 [Bdellovibrio bacteriovorus]